MTTRTNRTSLFLATVATFGLLVVTSGPALAGGVILGLAVTNPVVGAAAASADEKHDNNAATAEKSSDSVEMESAGLAARLVAGGRAGGISGFDDRVVRRLPRLQAHGRRGRADRGRNIPRDRLRRGRLCADRRLRRIQ